ncbi:hypothetical protein BGZ74_006548, partial [Mortierella antarctica]
MPRIMDEDDRFRQQAMDSASAVAGMIGSCGAQMAVRIGRGETPKDVLAPGQHLIKSMTTFSQSDRDAAKTLPALLTKNRYFVLQTTGLSLDSFKMVKVGVERDSVHPYLLENMSIFKENNKDDISTSKDDHLPGNVGNAGSSSSSSSDLEDSSSSSSSTSSPEPPAGMELHPEANAAD